MPMPSSLLRQAITPFTTDQLAALLNAATPILNLANSIEADMNLAKARGDEAAEKYLVGRLFGYARSADAMIRLAVSGLPAELAAEVCKQNIEGKPGSLFTDVLNGRTPPSAILDALCEFLARPGQAIDKSIVEAATPLVVPLQRSLDEPGVDQQRHVAGENAGLDWRPVTQEIVEQPLAVSTPAGQNDPAD